ncbi:hypothetical protein EWM64_g3974 [Hericium alpestre]|uniref:Phosphatidylinositol transfer protein SFH5 n=1 Tax=Hericium alpestre TaxID=135208 RepID=A0A4Z0A2W9_9AGAM|nr:hypothetical protein EWM64_g3974 [Hericium alpestre]
MRAALPFLSFLSCLLPSIAINLPLTKRVSYGSATKTYGQGLNYFNLTSLHDDGSLQNEAGVYTTEITLGGQNFTVAIDTGSADLWIGARGPSNVKLTNTTDLAVNTTYAVGLASGLIGFADLTVGHYNVSSQAFLNVNKTVNLDFGAANIDGIIGLAFDANSQIDNRIQNAWGNDTTLGRTVMSHLFAQDPFAPNFITFLLGREGDLDDIHNGVFTVSEYQEGLETVQNSTHIPRFPPQSHFWSVLLDEMHVNGQAVPLNSSVPDTPSGKAVVVLDSGFTQPPLPQLMVHAIYSSMPEAFLYDGTWFMPCNSSVNLTFTFGGFPYPVHPLDVTTVGVIPLSNGQNATVCTNIFAVEEESQFGPGLDMIFGQPFLHNTYSLFDYGDIDVNGTLISDPFVQLLSVEVDTDLQDDFLKSRSTALSQLPPEISMPQLKVELQKLDQEGGGASESSSAAASQPTSASPSTTSSPSASPPSTNSTTNGSKSDDSAFAQDDVSADATPKLSSAVADDSGSSYASQLLDKVDKYGPVVLALLGANVLVGIILRSYQINTAPAPEPAAVPLPSSPLPEAAAAVAPAEPAPAPKAAAETEAKPTETPAPTATKKEEEEPQNALTKKFTEQEWEALKEFRKELPEIFASAYDSKADAKTTAIQLWGVTIDPNGAKDARASVILMKWLRARNLNVAEAKTMMIATLRWRDEFKVDEALKEEFPEEVFGRIGHVFGKDKNGRPITYNLYGANKDIKAVFGDVQRFLRWRIKLMEEGIKKIDFETVDQMIQVHDYEGVSMRSRDENSKNAASEASSIFGSHYPEFLYSKLFVNVPGLMTWIFWIFRVIVPSATFAKMKVIGSGPTAIGKEMLLLVPKDQLPKRYGGDAEPF